MDKEKILKRELSGFELFPNTDKEDKEFMLDSIYCAMETYAKHENEAKDNQIAELKEVVANLYFNVGTIEPHHIDFRIKQALKE